MSVDSVCVCMTVMCCVCVCDCMFALPFFLVMGCLNLGTNQPVEAVYIGKKKIELITGYCIYTGLSWDRYEQHLAGFWRWADIFLTSV